jgi:putative component of membrane protein insertase Oxa1/YidC/SpoIIIJ protein YidD
MQRLILVLFGVYRRWLTRYTPKCPDPVSCSAYGVWAVRTFGATVGLELALEKVKQCGSRSEYLPHMQSTAP